MYCVGWSTYSLKAQPFENKPTRETLQCKWLPDYTITTFFCSADCLYYTDCALYASFRVSFPFFVLWFQKLKTWELNTSTLFVSVFGEVWVLCATLKETTESYGEWLQRRRTILKIQVIRGVGVTFVVGGERFVTRKLNHSKSDEEHGILMWKLVYLFFACKLHIKWLHDYVSSWWQ